MRHAKSIRVPGALFLVGAIFILMASGAAPLNAANQFGHLDPLYFTMPFGGANPLPQLLMVVELNAPPTFGYGASATTSSGGNWLFLNARNLCCGFPTEWLLVSVKAPAGLAVGTYLGQVALSGGGAAENIQVTLTVGPAGGSFFDNTPGGLSFSCKTGPNCHAPSQSLQLRNYNSGAPMNWTLAATTYNGGNWLTTTTTSGTTPSEVTVGITVANVPGGGLQAGTFTGTLTFQATGGTVTVPIAFIVGDSVFEQVNPLSFTKPFAGQSPLPQILSVGTTNAAFGFSLAAYTANGNSANGNWLSLGARNLCCGFATEVISVTADPAANVAPGAYTGQVIFFACCTVNNGVDYSFAMVVPVNLTVGTPGTPFFDNVPGQMTFSLTPGAAAPPAQSVLIQNAGTGTLSWTLTTMTFDGGTWLTASPPNGNAPSSITVSISPQNLPGLGQVAGTFSGQLLFQASGSSVTVPISVTVGANAFEQANGLSFTMPLGGPNPLPQTLVVAHSGSAFGYGVSASTATGGNWLRLGVRNLCCGYSSEVIAVEVITPTPALSVGTYTGQIVFAGNGPVMTVPVTLTVVNPVAAPLLDNMQGQMTFSLKAGGAAPPSQLVSVRNAGTGTLNWTLTPTTADSGNWLTVSAQNGAAPFQVSVGILPQNLPGGGVVPGVFSGQLLFQSAGGNTSIPISVTVGGSYFEQVNGLSFVKPFQAAGNPLTQVLTIPIVGNAFGYGITFYTASGGNWLQVPARNECCGFQSETFAVSINAPAGMAAGTYTGEIVLFGVGVPQGGTGLTSMTIPVTLTILPVASSFFADIQGGMSFSFAAGSANPPSQSFAIRNGGNGSLNWTATINAYDGGNWLTLSVPSGSAPSNLTVGVNVANMPGSGLVNGYYTGQLLLQSANSNVTIPISVVVGSSIFVQDTLVTFTIPVGGSPGSQVLIVNENGTTFGYTANGSSGTGGNWFTIQARNLCCGLASESINGNVNVTGLAPGTYMAEFYFQGFNQTTTVPVILNVTSSFTLNPGSASSPVGGGPGNVSFTVGVQTDHWAAFSNVDWITITSTPTGIGNGNVSYSVAANTTGAARAGTMTIAGQTFTVNQAGGTNHPSFFNGEDPLANGVYYLQFADGMLFGYYSYLPSSFIFHFDMGYEYVFDVGGGAAYLYDFASTHWLYTSSSLFPTMYDFTIGSWIFYFVDPNNPGHYTTNPRYFVNLTTNKIFTM